MNLFAAYKQVFLGIFAITYSHCQGSDQNFSGFLTPGCGTSRKGAKLLFLDGKNDVGHFLTSSAQSLSTGAFRNSDELSPELSTDFVENFIFSLDESWQRRKLHQICARLRSFVAYRHSFLSCVLNFATF